MKSQLLKYSLSLLLALSLNAKETYTVDELILEALKNSPDLKISSSQYSASKERLSVATSDYLPRVDLQVGIGQTGMSDIPTNPDDMVTDNLMLGRLSLKQIIYDFGKTGGNVDLYKYDSASYSMANEQQVSDKIRDVKNAYYNVLQAISIIKVNEENVKLNESQLHRSQKYFDAGIRTRIDISDAKVELIKSKLNLKKSLYDLKLSYAALDKVVGFMDTELKYNVYSGEVDLNNLYCTLSDYDLTLIQAIEFAYENRYTLKQYMAQIKSAEAKRSISSSQYYPALYLGADYTKQKPDEFKTSAPEDQWQASVNIDWNIYQGGATSADTQEKQILIEKSKLEMQNSKLAIKKETTQAFINLYKAKDSVELSQNLLEVSAEKFDQAGKRYEYGLSDYIELQQARQGYIDSKASLVVDYYNYYSAVAVLDNAIGK